MRHKTNLEAVKSGIEFYTEVLDTTDRENFVDRLDTASIEELNLRFQEMQTILISVSMVRDMIATTLIKRDPALADIKAAFGAFAAAGDSE